MPSSSYGLRSSISQTNGRDFEMSDPPAINVASLPETSIRKFLRRLVVSIDRKNAEEFGVPYGSRTRVAAVKGRCPRPLDERDACGESVMNAASQ